MTPMVDAGHESTVGIAGERAEVGGLVAADRRFDGLRHRGDERERQHTAQADDAVAPKCLDVVGADRHPETENPPSTTTVCPVMNPAAGLARKSTVGAISSGCANRPSGVRASAGAVSGS